MAYYKPRERLKQVTGLIFVLLESPELTLDRNIHGIGSANIVDLNASR